MIKKLIHFSDLHVRLYKDHALYKSIMEEAFTQWKNISPDRIVFTGDLVHSKNQMTPELVEFIAWVLTECSKIAKTILIPGNHDFLESNLERLDALTPVVDSLKNDEVVYYKNRGVYADENIDWCVYSLMDHNIPPDIEKSDRVKIGLFHGPVQGLTTNLGFNFEDGFESSKFDIPGGKKAYMIGSTICQNYGETVTKHGYGIYDVEKNEYQTIDLHNPKPFLSFRINSYEDIENGTEKFVNY
jgi:hypothetical protein